MRKVGFLICLLTVLIALSSCKKKSSEKEILEFRFSSPEVEAIINENLKTVEAVVPYGTDVTTLEPIIVVSNQATINPQSGTPTDFTNPVTYTVTAEDGSQSIYTATVTVEALTYQSFVGIWSVEKVEYYQTDNAGNPIENTMEVINYDPNDINNGIQLVFREDKTGEKREHIHDTLYVGDQMIILPDTTIVSQFTYSYDTNQVLLIINLEEGPTFMLETVEFTLNSFVYECEYKPNHYEKAYLRRLSNVPDKSNSTKCSNHIIPYKESTLLRR